MEVLTRQGAVHPNMKAHGALPEFRGPWPSRGVFTITIACSARGDGAAVLLANAGAPTVTAMRQVTNTKSERSRLMTTILLPFTSGAKRRCSVVHDLWRSRPR